MASLIILDYLKAVAILKVLIENICAIYYFQLILIHVFSRATSYISIQTLLTKNTGKCTQHCDVAILPDQNA